MNIMTTKRRTLQHCIAQFVMAALAASRPLLAGIVGVLLVSLPVAADNPSEVYFDFSGGYWDVTPTEVDPISTGSGAFFEDWQLYSLGGVMNLHFTLHYRPELWNHFPTDRARRLDSGFGVFTSNHTIELIDMTRISSGERSASILFGDHEEILTYDSGSGQYNSTGSVPYQLTTDTDYYYLSDPLQQRVYIFKRVSDTFADLNGFNANWWGRVATVLDRNGNRLDYSYTNETLTSVSDNLGRTLTLDYGAVQSNPLQTVTDTNGRTVSFTSGVCTFASMTDQLLNTTQFQTPAASNQCRLITSIVKPKGNSHIDQTWTSTPRGAWFFGVAAQDDAYGNTTQLSYSQDASGNTQISFTYPDSSTGGVQNENERYPVKFTDSSDKQATFGYNSDHQITSIIDRLNATTTLTHHSASGQLASFTNAKGNTLSHSYTAQSQSFTNPANAFVFSFTFYDRTRTDYPDSTYETFVYDPKGNLTTYTDRNGKNTIYTYNLQGLPSTITNAIGGVIAYTYNADATLATSTDSDTGDTSYGYDGFKRLTSINPPGTGQIDIAYDAMDRITQVTDENSHNYQYQYDTNGNLTKITDPQGNFTQYAYDLMDRVGQVTSRTNGISTMNYNYRGRVISTTNPNSIQTGYSYNSRNWLESVTSNGKTMSFTQDDEGVATGSTSPAGHTTQQQTDKLGHVKSVILPGGETTSLTRDSMTRVAGATDPLNHLTQYGYDNNGILAQVIMPEGGSATYSRDNSGNLTGINDLNNKNWGFTYTTMGRLTSTTDPLSQTSQYSRDTRGRISTVTYPDSSTETRSFDDSSNIIRRFYSDTTDLTYTYDAMNNLSSTNDLTLTRDNEGRITSSSYNGETFGVTYDAGGRITTATYGGALTVTYSYNNDNLLNRVSDTLSNQIDFIYDADGNPTSITRSNGINSSMTWDSNGRLSRLQDGSIIDLQYSYNAAGQITSMNGVLPLDPAQYLSNTSKSFTVDAASQVNSSGYGYDSRGRATLLPGHILSWNDAERLTSLDSVVFSYNGLNEIIKRTEGTTTTRFYHNQALGLSPIVAEEHGGTFSRYYVYTPSGQLLYSFDPQDANAVFYHRDQIGSTLALTNGEGTVTDRYAYSPFGELLGHTGSSDQPYTFVGTFGVRQEGDIYQMRLRYYDPVTARFLSKEQIWPQTDDPQSLNPYQYALGRPVEVVDVTGLGPDDALWSEGFRLPQPPKPLVSKLITRGISTQHSDTVLFDGTGSTFRLNIGGNLRPPYHYSITTTAIVSPEWNKVLPAGLNLQGHLPLTGERGVRANSHGMTMGVRVCKKPKPLKVWAALAAKRWHKNVDAWVKEQDKHKDFLLQFQLAGFKLAGFTALIDLSGKVQGFPVTYERP